MLGRGFAGGGETPSVRKPRDLKKGTPFVAVKMIVICSRLKHGKNMCKICVLVRLYLQMSVIDDWQQELLSFWSSLVLLVLRNDHNESGKDSQRTQPEFSIIFPWLEHEFSHGSWNWLYLSCGFYTFHGFSDVFCCPISRCFQGARLTSNGSTKFDAELMKFLIFVDRFG